eukprot:m.127971 g.127971  ORF g.127971 m.127971 type:complete len:74 (-) comp11220_c0_seq5:308-529(-)
MLQHGVFPCFIPNPMQEGPSYLYTKEMRVSLKAAYRRTRTLLHVVWHCVVVGDVCSDETTKFGEDDITGSSTQ